MQAADCSLNASSQDTPAAVPRSVEVAVAGFDADRENSPRYLLRASALLAVKRRGSSAASAGRSRSRSGLSASELSCVVNHIEMRLGDKITARELANLIDVSSERLFRAFKISVGLTPLRYVTMRRVELVCTMLMTTREPICQLALACGWSDQAHLSRVFRRTIGMSPSAWRRAMRGLKKSCRRQNESLF
jgi:AraC family transcriptional regulator